MLCPLPCANPTRFPRNQSKSGGKILCLPARLPRAHALSSSQRSSQRPRDKAIVATEHNRSPDYPLSYTATHHIRQDGTYDPPSPASRRSARLRGRRFKKQARAKGERRTTKAVAGRGGERRKTLQQASACRKRARACFRLLDRLWRPSRERIFRSAAKRGRTPRARSAGAECLSDAREGALSGRAQCGCTQRVARKRGVLDGRAGRQGG